MPFKRATNCAITPSFVCRIIVLHFESVVNNTTAVCTKLVAEARGKLICEGEKAPPLAEVIFAKALQDRRALRLLQGFALRKIANGTYFLCRKDF